MLFRSYYRLATVALVHGGFLHLGFNLYALYVLGLPVEAYFGRLRYVLILAASLLGGSLLSIYMNPINVFSIGASGMIFGLFASLALIGKRVGVEWRSILVVVGINFALGTFNTCKSSILFLIESNPALFTLFWFRRVLIQLIWPLFK